MLTLLSFLLFVFVVVLCIFVDGDLVLVLVVCATCFLDNVVGGDIVVVLVVCVLMSVCRRCR